MLVLIVIYFPLFKTILKRIGRWTLGGFLLFLCLKLEQVLTLWALFCTFVSQVGPGSDSVSPFLFLCPKLTFKSTFSAPEID